MIEQSAVISQCGLYRYRLDRCTGDHGSTIVGFVMVNPSTADATHDDPTIRKCAGYATKMAARRLIVGNLFAFRATDVRELRSTRDPIGPDNDQHLREIMTEATVLVAAWGSLNKLPEALRTRWKDVVKLADASGKTLQMIDTCSDGHPRHPLMTSYDNPLSAWPVPWFPNRNVSERRT